MSNCVAYKTVSRLGKPHRVCAKMEASAGDDIMVRKDDTDVGAYSLSRIGLLGPLKGLRANDFAGPAVGLTGTLLGTAVAKRWGHLIGSWVVDYAPIPGAIIGSLLSLPLTAWRGGGSKAAQAGVVTALATGLGLLLAGKVESFVLGLGNSSSTGAYTLNRVGSVGALPVARDYTSVPGSVSSAMTKAAFGKSYMNK